MQRLRAQIRRTAHRFPIQYLNPTQMKINPGPDIPDNILISPFFQLEKKMDIYKSACLNRRP